MKHAAILLAVAALATRVALPDATRDAGVRIELEKLDPAVRAAMDSGRTAQVVVLGRTQLFAPVGGLEAFEARNANRQRLALRAEVIATLKQTARAEQRTILAAIGRREAMRSLWIANAMVLSLSPDEIRRVAALDAVRFVYPNNETITPQESPSRVSVVLEPTARAPFDAIGKRIGWNVERLGAPRVWRELGVTGEGVVVAVLDVGVNYVHRDLRQNIWVNWHGRDPSGAGVSVRSTTARTS